MEIVVNAIRDYYYGLSYTVFDTHSGKFSSRTNLTPCRSVTELNGVDYSIIKNYGSFTLLGVYGRNYVICNTSCRIGVISKKDIVVDSYQNIRTDKLGRIFCTDGKLEDLSYLFKTDTVNFKGYYSTGSSGSSNGVAYKFFGQDRKTKVFGIVKACRLSTSLRNELEYKRIADKLNIPAVPVKPAIYCGRQYIFSQYIYNSVSDIWLSFASIMKLHKCSEADIVQQYGIIHDYYEAMLLDYITGASDRHMHNIAICNNKLYPMFDNECAFTDTVNIHGCSATHLQFVERHKQLLTREMYCKLMDFCNTDTNEFTKGKIKELLTKYGY